MYKTFNTLEVSWRDANKKGKSNSDFPFMESDIFSLVEMIDNKNSTPVSPEKDSIIVIIQYVRRMDGKPLDEDDRKIFQSEVIPFIKNYYKSNYDLAHLIITSRISPEFGYISAEEKFVDIVGIDGLQGYSISNYQNIKNNTTNEIIGDEYKVMSDVGPAVLLEFGSKYNYTMQYVSINYLMMHAFHPSMILLDKGPSVRHGLWDNRMEELCKLFESLNFECIDNFCRFEFSSAYVYADGIGRSIIDLVEKINNNEESAKNV